MTNGCYANDGDDDDDGGGGDANISNGIDCDSTRVFRTNVKIGFERTKIQM